MFVRSKFFSLAIISVLVLCFCRGTIADDSTAAPTNAAPVDTGPSKKAEMDQYCHTVLIVVHKVIVPPKKANATTTPQAAVNVSTTPVATGAPSAGAPGLTIEASSAAAPPPAARRQLDFKNLLLGTIIDEHFILTSALQLKDAEAGDLWVLTVPDFQPIMDQLAALGRGEIYEDQEEAATSPAPDSVPPGSDGAEGPTTAGGNVTVLGNATGAAETTPPKRILNPIERIELVLLNKATKVKSVNFAPPMKGADGNATLINLAILELAEPLTLGSEVKVSPIENSTWDMDVKDRSCSIISTMTFVTNTAVKANREANCETCTDLYKTGYLCTGAGCTCLGVPGASMFCDNNLVGVYGFAANEQCIPSPTTSCFTCLPGFGGYTFLCYHLEWIHSLVPNAPGPIDCGGEVASKSTRLVHTLFVPIFCLVTNLLYINFFSSM